MSRQILSGEVIGLGDVALGGDQVAHPSGQTHLEVVFALFAFGVEGPANRMVCIGKQLVGKLRPISEGFLLFYRVKTCAKNDTVGGFKFGGSITEPLSLKRSTRC